MKLIVAAIGRLGRGPEGDLAAGFAGRIDAMAKTTRIGPISILETEDKTRRGAAGEAAALARIGQAERRVVLDERGRVMPSKAFAQQLGAWRDAGAGSAAFLIGGADGHTPETRDSADLLLSFGAMTWPHALARAMLLEQIYRAQTILAGHPYHREG